MKYSLDDILVVIFSCGERTVELNELCFRKLGFNNIVILDGNDSFVDKYIKYSKLGIESDYSYFIRNDADRLVFDGLLELVDYGIKNNIDITGGECFDYLMNNYRVGTPQFTTRKFIEPLFEDNTLMLNVQKPESAYIKCLRKNNNIKTDGFSQLTNLHDFEQYPSKICNTFLNRIFRGDYPRLYNIDYLNKLPNSYKLALQTAFDFARSNKEKESMKYIDFTFLDDNFESLPRGKELEAIYDLYRQLYNRLYKK